MQNGYGKPKIGLYYMVRKERVPKELAEKTWIRWLITKDDGAPLFSMRVFTIEPGGHIKAHRHPWEHEIFVLSGVGEIRIGEQVYRVTKGFYVYIPPNIEHEYWNKGSEPLEFVCIIPNEPTATHKEK